MGNRVSLEGLGAVAIDDLVGTWHIVETNFPMWLTGKKTQPTLNYRAAERGLFVEDIVRYTERGRTKEIRGVDTVDPANPAHFTWRGRGVLGLLTSEWYVVHLDRAAGVLATYFEPTLFTPAGVDIAARSPQPAEAALEVARAAVAAMPGLGDHVARLARAAKISTARPDSPQQQAP
jgi:hypothetical protein